MGDNSGIEWLNALPQYRGATWNFLTGCDKVSPGCRTCYAETFAERFRGVKGHPYEQGFDFKVWGERLDLPVRWTKPRCIFVNSMSDFFHEKAPFEVLQRAFDVMAKCPQHLFLILTKRPERMVEVMRKVATHEPHESISTPWAERQLTNVWLGVSVENQHFAERRIPLLLETPARVHFISAEPLLGPLDLRRWLGTEECEVPGIDWVIVGGESGAGARPMRPEWVRDIREQCGGTPHRGRRAGRAARSPASSGRRRKTSAHPSAHRERAEAAKVAFFFKQWGGVRKGRAGRELDGRTHDGMPVVPAALDVPVPTS